MISVSTLISTDDRIFVAGHRGMVGNAIFQAFKRAGYNNLLTVSRSELDLLDSSAVERWFSTNQPTVVVLAAAKVGGIQANNNYPADFLVQNIKIQTHVIETAWRYGVRRLLFLGSSCIYPKYANQPIKEEALLTGELEPTNEWYAIAKIAGIKFCEALRRQHGFDAICLMPTNLYGPGDNYHATNSHVLPALIRRFHEATEANLPNVICWGTGSPLREFLHVDDLGEACVFALENWDPSCSTAPKANQSNLLNFLNVGTGNDIRISVLAETIAKSLGFKGNILWDESKPDGTPKKQLDVSRLSEMGWTARISLTEGLSSTIAAFRDELKCQRIRL